VTKCINCPTQMEPGEFVTVGNNPLCDDCIESLYMPCTNCGEQVDQDDAWYLTSGTYCDECRHECATYADLLDEAFAMEGR